MTAVAETQKEMYRAGYQPAPEMPDWFARRLGDAGGRVLDGRPRFRVVWGMDARGFPWPEPDAPKYINPNDPTAGWACWILEQLVAPEFFGEPSEWERARFSWIDGQRVETMAPYPSRGEYVLVQPLVFPDGVPAPLTEQTLEYCVWLIRNHHSRPLNAYTNQRLIAERMARIEEWRADQRRETDARLAGIYDEAARTGDETNRLATREWNKLPADAFARARRFLKKEHDDTANND